MSTATLPAVSVAIATYRGRDSLEPLVDQLVEILRQRHEPFEVVVVNDASPDDTWDVLSKLVERHPELVVIDLLTNHGQALATLCGLAHARGTVVATMDDDLQQPPEELPKLLDALDAHEEWDAVVGQWSRDAGLMRDLGSWVHALVHRLAHRTPTSYRHTTFRVLRRPVVDALLAHETRTPLIGALLRQITHRIGVVEVDHRERPFGTSSFRLSAGVSRVVTNLLQGSTAPLRALSLLGVGSSLLALVLAAVFLMRLVLGAQTPPGWMSSFLAVLFFGGATLFGVGLLGEYTSLVLREVRRPPRWNVRERLGRRDTGAHQASDHGDGSGA